MIKHVVLFGLIAVGAGACAVEHRTVVVASGDACTNYGFTQSTDDYMRCQRMVADRRRLGRVTVGYDDAQIMAESRTSCASYGVPGGTAQFDRCVQDEFAARRPG
jgi:hypothetical protein